MLSPGTHEHPSRADGLRFIFIDASIHYVDERGEHSGRLSDSADTEEERCRLATVSNDNRWLRAAVALGRRLRNEERVPREAAEAKATEAAERIKALETTFFQHAVPGAINTADENYALLVYGVEQCIEPATMLLTATGLGSVFDDIAKAGVVGTKAGKTIQRYAYKITKAVFAGGWVGRYASSPLRAELRKLLIGSYASSIEVGLNALADLVAQHGPGWANAALRPCWNLYSGELKVYASASGTATAVLTSSGPGGFAPREGPDQFFVA